MRTTATAMPVPARLFFSCLLVSVLVAGLTMRSLGGGLATGGGLGGLGGGCVGGGRGGGGGTRSGGDGGGGRADRERVWSRALRR